MISYLLHEEGITFYVDGIIVFDCPFKRMENNPQEGLKALEMLEDFWKRKIELLKGGDIR